MSAVFGIDLTNNSNSSTISFTAFISVNGLTVLFTIEIEGNKKRMCCSFSFDSTSHNVIPPGESTNAYENEFAFSF